MFRVADGIPHARSGGIAIAYRVVGVREVDVLETVEAGGFVRSETPTRLTCSRCSAAAD
jgi:hypothetical protein